MTPVTLIQICEYLSPLSPLAHSHVCLSRKILQETGWGEERYFSSDSTTGDSGDSGDAKYSGRVSPRPLYIWILRLNPYQRTDQREVQRQPDEVLDGGDERVCARCVVKAQLDQQPRQKEAEEGRQRYHTGNR